MAVKDLEGLRRVAEEATPETVEAVSRFLGAAGSDEFHQVLAARTLAWFARGVELLDRDLVMEALAAPAGYEAVLPLVEEVVLADAGHSPVVRARLRGIHRKKELLEAEGGSVSTAEAAQILGGISKQAVDKRRERGTILALPAGSGGYAFPLWQFDERSSDGLIPRFARVLKSFSVNSQWMRAEFMLAPSARFDGRRPLDALVAGEVEEVARAASAYGEQGAQQRYPAEEPALVPQKVPEDFDRRALHVVRQGGPWYRFHDKDYSPLYFGKARKYRFDDPAGEYGVMYVAQDEFGAFVETFLRDPELTLIDEEELRKRRLSVIQASGLITLVDVMGKGLQHAGVTGDVSTAPHQEVQPLSRAIYEHPSRPDGIRYRLSHDLSRIGIAVFDRAVLGVELPHEDRGSLLDPSNQTLLGGLLDRYGKDLA